MKTAERIVLVLMLLAFVGGGAWIYFAVQYEHQQKVDAVARGEYEIRPATTTSSETATSDWRTIYPETIPMSIAGVPVLASIADSLPERIQGLSGTPYLPDNVVKLFVFGANGNHSIWMKDMLYAIDILWVTEDGEIVHIEQNVSPDTFPESFSSPVPAWYVIETAAGFTATNDVTVGERIEVTIAP